MGLATCKKHEKSSVISGISLDICQDFEHNPATIQKIVIVNIEIFDGDQYLYTQKNYVSEKIFIDNNLEKNYRITNEEQEDSLNLTFPKTSGMCGKCFEEYISGNRISIEK